MCKDLATCVQMLLLLRTTHSSHLNFILIISLNNTFLLFIQLCLLANAILILWNGMEENYPIEF